MSSGVPIEPIDVLLFRRNRDQLPDEQLEPYWGKQVAWSGDGTGQLVGQIGGVDVIRLTLSASTISAAAIRPCRGSRR